MLGRSGVSWDSVDQPNMAHYGSVLTSKGVYWDIVGYRGIVLASHYGSVLTSKGCVGRDEDERQPTCGHC